MTNIYQKYGYKNRTEYLRGLALEYEVDVEYVFTAASMLGPSEDFDGLISAIEDFW